MRANSLKLLIVVLGSLGLVSTAVGNRVVAIKERRLQEEKGSDKDECKCEEYLKSDYLWDIVEDILQFPDFCCVLSVLAYHNFHYGNNGGKFDRAMTSRELNSDTATDFFIESFLSLAAETNNVTEVEIAEQIEISFAEDLVGAWRKDSGNNNKNNRYCDGIYGIYKLKCLLEKRLSEGVDACYCYYRGIENCDYKEQCDVDTNMDVQKAPNDFAACFQCPSGKKKRDWRQRELQSNDSGNGSGNTYEISGNKFDLSGKPYNTCLGYCFLFGTFHHPGW